MTHHIPREFIENLLTRVNLVDLVHTAIPLHKKSGNNYFACCPFHQENSASFSVSEIKQFYYCFGCGAHGNAIDFMMQYHHLPFPEAVETLANQVGLPLPTTTPQKTTAHASLTDLLQQVATYYYENGQRSSVAQAYFEKRGLSKHTVKQFLLGYAPPDWHQLLAHFGQSEKTKKQLLDTGLIIHKEGGGYYDRFRDRVLFPIQNVQGKYIGFGGRILQQGEPKYLNSPETSLFQKGHELYGLHLARTLNRQLTSLLLVEGYMDVIGLFEHGICNAVATLGTATTVHHFKQLFRYTHHLIFCFDGDLAGRTAAERALLTLLPLLEDHLQIQFLFLPETEDPDSIIRKEGKTAFEKRLLEALPLSQFFFQIIDKHNPRHTIEERARFAARALSTLHNLPDRLLLKAALLDELSKKTRLSLQDLTQKQLQKTKTPTHRWVAAPLPFTKPICLILTLLIQQPTLAQTLPLIEADQIGEGGLLINQLIEIIKKNPSITTGGLMEHWREAPEAALIAQLAQTNHIIPPTGAEAELLGAIRQATLQAQERRIRQLLTQASQNTLSSQEKQLLAQLIAQKKSTMIS